jgi:hypothetical protein
MTATKVGKLGAVVLVWRDEGVVGSDVEHVLACLGSFGVYGEVVAGAVDGAPVG